MLLAHAIQRLFHFFVGHDDLRMVGAKFLVALDFDLGHHFETGLEAQRFAVMHVQIGDPRLRDRNQALLFGLLAEVAGTSASTTSFLMSSEKRCRMMEAGTCPLRKPGMRASF